MESIAKAVILIVDDKPVNILALENLLADQDRLLLSAPNGKEALQIALNKNVDLIILDVQMPDMDGFEVAQLLKSNKKTRDIPIIFATAESRDHQFVMKGYDEGAVDYLSKPLNPEIVKAKVAGLLKVQLQKKELMEKNASLQKSALLIDNSADIIGIIDARTFKIDEINRAFTSILGYTPEEVINSTLTAYLGAEDREMVEALGKNEKEQLSFETCIYSKDRSSKWLQWNVVARYGKWFVNARDISERRKAEEALKESERRFRNLFELAPYPMWVYDLETLRFLEVNQSSINHYGYSRDEFLRMGIADIRPEEDIERLIKDVNERDLENQTSAGWQHRLHNGQVIDVEITSHLMDFRGRKAALVIAKDVTDQKKAEARIKQLNEDLMINVRQLEATNKELESFSYSVSHDLRAPLRGLNGYSQMLEEDYGPVLDDEAKRLLGNIQRNADKMGRLIDDLLDFSRLGRKELQKSEVNMNDLVNDVVNEIATSTPHHAQVLVNDLWPADADASLLRQVWVNLISNAIKYSGKKEKPLVEIGANHLDGETVYYIKDNGTGFNMKYADKLFGVFQRLHNRSDFEGTGIGLAIVQRIVIKHGGKVWADAKENGGAIFYFSLPGAKHINYKTG